MLKTYLLFVSLYQIISGIHLDNPQQMQGENVEEHDFVIIGAGIAGLQAAIVLAQNKKDFVILEATNTSGGRIGTETLGEIINKEVNNPNAEFKQTVPKWISTNPNLYNVPIEYGATWIAKDHQYMHNLLKMLKIEEFPQYRQGDTVYGVQPGKYEPFETHYKKETKEVVSDMLDKIQKLKNKFQKLYEQAIQKQYKDKYDAYKAFIDKYDTMSVKQFISQEIDDPNVAAEVMNFIECLQCIGCEKFSMMQLIDDDDSLAIVYESVGDKSEADDDFRVKTGMISVIRAMVNLLVKLVQEYDPEAELADIIKFNEPVTRIQSWKDKNSKECKTYTKGPNGNKIYSSRRVLNSIPLATLNKVNITGISAGKKLIFDGQEMGIVYRNYLIFRSPFWREQFNGYGSFGPKFPFTEMTDISPASNQCGILAFVCYGEKYKQWIQKMPSSADRHQFLKSVVADMFLKGDKNSPLLAQTLTYTRTFTNFEYIGAAYQPTTKIGVWKAVEDIGEDYGECFETDQNGVHFIGSQFDEQYGSYMEGALRVARKKTFQLISKSDPWYK